MGAQPKGTLTLRLSPELHRLLRWHYANTGEPMSGLIRRLIEEWSKENAIEGYDRMATRATAKENH